MAVVHAVEREGGRCQTVELAVQRQPHGAVAAGALQQRGVALAGAKGHGVCEKALVQGRVLVELTRVAVGQEQVAAAPVGVEALLRQLQRPVFHAEEGQRRAQVGAALLVVGQLVERAQVGHALCPGPRSRHGLAGLEQVGVDLRQQHVGHGVLVVQCGSLVQRGDGVLVAPELVVGDGSPGLGTGVARLHHASAQKGVERRFGLALLEPQQAQAGEGNVVGALVLQRSLEGVFGVGKAVGKGLQRAAFALGLRQVRCQRNGLLQVLARGAGVLALGVRAAQAQPAACVLRGQLGGFGVGGQCARRIALAAGQGATGERQFGVGCLALGERGSGVARAVLQQLRAGQLGQQCGVGGPLLQRALQGCHCGLAFAAHQQQVGLHEPHRQGGALGHLLLRQCACFRPLAGLQGDGQFQGGAPGCRRLGARLGQGAARAVDLACRQRGAHRLQRRRQGLGGQVGQWVGLQGVDPLHALARLHQHELDRGLAHFGIGGFVGAQCQRALGVAKLHRARQHREQCAPVGLHADVPVGATDGSGGGGGLQLQRAAGRAACLRPGAPGLQAQRGGALPGRGQRLDLQHRVLVQAHLGLVGKQQGHARGLACTHKVASSQGLCGARGAPGRGAGRALVTRALQVHDLSGGACGQGGQGVQGPRQGQCAEQGAGAKGRQGHGASLVWVGRRARWGVAEIMRLAGDTWIQGWHVKATAP